MSIYIRDRLRTKTWAEGLRQRLGLGVIVKLDSDDVDLSKIDNVSEASVILVHTQTAYNRTGWITGVGAKLVKAHLVFVSQGDRISKKDIFRYLNEATPNGTNFESLPERVHACYWTVDEFSAPPPRLGRWLDQVKAGDSSQVDWSLLLPDNEKAFALRLLCEAWLQTQGQRLKVQGAMTLHGPSVPGDWFAPFGLNASTASADAIAADVVTDRDLAGEFLRKIAQTPAALKWPEAEPLVKALSIAVAAAR